VRRTVAEQSGVIVPFTCKRIATFAIVWLGLHAATVRAQTPAVDPVFARARQLVVAGNGAAGRLLIDSVLSATPAESPVFGEALYWRAAFAVTSADAEHDYERLVVEYPFSPHVGDALLQLAQLESGRGDRAAASRNIERFLLENPTSAQRPKAELELVRLWFDQNDLPRGCSALKRAIADTPPAEIEQRNQLDFFSPRCMANDVGPGGRVPVGAGVAAPTVPPAAPAVAANKDSAAAAKESRTKAAGKFTLQIAAYKSKAEADGLARKLDARKLDARVVPSGKLFRVRVGRYESRAQAVKAQKELKAKKIDAFVAEIGADDR
jgi:hypothetical protein